MQDNQIHLKIRINQVYRNHLILNYYMNKLLNDSMPTEFNLKKIENTKKIILEASKEKIQNLSNITSKSFSLNDYLDPLKFVIDFLNSEFFFDVRGIIDDVITIYEKSLSPLIVDFRISPLDQMKVSRIDFV